MLSLFPPPFVICYHMYLRRRQRIGCIYVPQGLEAHFWPWLSHCCLTEMFNDKKQEPLIPWRVKDSFMDAHWYQLKLKSKVKTKTKLSMVEL